MTDTNNIRLASYDFEDLPVTLSFAIENTDRVSVFVTTSTTETRLSTGEFAVSDAGVLSVSGDYTGSKVVALYEPDVRVANSGFAPVTRQEISEITAKVHENFELLEYRIEQAQRTPLGFDLPSDLTQEVNLALVTDQATAAANSAAAAAVSAATAALYDGPTFDKVEDFFDDEAMAYGVSGIAAGVIIAVRKERYAYEIADSAALDHHVTTAGGIKAYYRPTGTFCHLRALLRDPTVTGIPAASQHALIQMGIDIAISDGVAVSLGIYHWRADETLYWGSVGQVAGLLAQIYSPPDGTYSQWYQSGFGPDSEFPAFYTDTMTAAHDVSGGNFHITGQVAFHSRYLNSFTYADRSSINQNLACFGGLQGAVPHLSSKGRTRIEGFAHPFYVPDLFTAGDSRQFARRTGEWEIEFCLSPIGYYGTASNGSDDNDAQFYVNRCGGFGSVTHSEVTGSGLHFGYFFAMGLTSKTGDTDAEDSRASVTAGSATVPFDQDISGILQADDVICILDAATRTNGDAIPLVTKVVSVAGDGMSVDVDAAALPERTASNLEWYYRPPRIELNNAYLNADNGYVEGFWDTICLGRRASVNFMSLKGGGARLSGRGGALFSTNSETASVTVECENELLESAGIGWVVAFGNLVRDSDSVDASIGGLIRIHMASTETLKVLPARAINPMDFASGTYSLQAASIRDIGLQIAYTDGVAFGFFAQPSSGGAYTISEKTNGRAISGGVTVRSDAPIGTAAKTVSVSDAATEIYDFTSFGGTGVNVVRGISADGTEGFRAEVRCTGAGDFALSVINEDGCTVSIDNAASPSELLVTRTTAGSVNYRVNFTPELI